MVGYGHVLNEAQFGVFLPPMLFVVTILDSM